MQATKPTCWAPFLATLKSKKKKKEKKLGRSIAITKRNNELLIGNIKCNLQRVLDPSKNRTLRISKAKKHNWKTEKNTDRTKSLEIAEGWRKVPSFRSEA